ncbi:hypothetical protein V8E52_009696 [Russula decolorans]|jgi:hypothetical protein
MFSLCFFPLLTLPSFFTRPPLSPPHPTSACSTFIIHPLYSIPLITQVTYLTSLTSIYLDPRTVVPESHRFSSSHASARPPSTGPFSHFHPSQLPSRRSSVADPRLSTSHVPKPSPLMVAAAAVVHGYYFLQNFTFFDTSNPFITSQPYTLTYPQHTS